MVTGMVPKATPLAPHNTNSESRGLPCFESFEHKRALKSCQTSIMKKRVRLKKQLRDIVYCLSLLITIQKCVYYVSKDTATGLFILSITSNHDTKLCALCCIEHNYRVENQTKWEIISLKEKTPEQTRINLLTCTLIFQFPSHKKYKRNSFIPGFSSNQARKPYLQIDFTLLKIH